MQSIEMVEINPPPVGVEPANVVHDEHALDPSPHVEPVVLEIEPEDANPGDHSSDDEPPVVNDRARVRFADPVARVEAEVIQPEADPAQDDNAADVDLYGEIREEEDVVGDPVPAEEARNVPHVPLVDNEEERWWFDAPGIFHHCPCFLWCLSQRTRNRISACIIIVFVVLFVSTIIAVVWGIKQLRSHDHRTDFASPGKSNVFWAPTAPAAKSSGDGCVLPDLIRKYKNHDSLIGPARPRKCSFPTQVNFIGLSTGKGKRQ